MRSMQRAFLKRPSRTRRWRELYRSLGEHERARDYYERVLLIEPENISALISMARLELSFGDFEAQLSQLNQALELGKTPEDRAQVLRALVAAYANRGQLATSIEYMELALEEMRQFQPPVMVLLRRLEWLDNYLEAGRAEDARQVYEAVASQLEPPFDMLLPLGQLSMALELEDADAAFATLPGLEQFIQAFGVEVFRPVIINAQGRIHELREEYREAIASYARELEFDPFDGSTRAAIGRCYRHLENVSEAQRMLQSALDLLPFSPDVHYELALVLADRGDVQEAMQHLGRGADGLGRRRTLCSNQPKTRDRSLQSWNRRRARENSEQGTITGVGLLRVALKQAASCQLVYTPAQRVPHALAWCVNRADEVHASQACVSGR